MTTYTHTDYSREASKIAYNDRKRYLLSLPETELHEELKSLFQRMDENDLVEITHGPDEFGRDLVIEHKDAWGKKYIGVVVKKGDRLGKITGELDSVVNDIITQTREALSHPCPLHEIATGVVQISEIRVIFVGRLTTKATLKVENEMKPAYIDTRGIGWLVDQFTNWYPEVFFQGKLAEFVNECISSLETKRELVVYPSPLSASFVNPWVSEIEAPSSFTEAVVETLRSRRLPFTELEDIVEQTRRILLTGDPGTGKSTALAKIAMDMFERCIQTIGAQKRIERLEIPILFKAHEILSKDIEELIHANLPTGPMRERLAVKVLLVDGLDEVKTDSRIEVINKLEDFCNSHQCGLVISTRKVEALGDAIFPFKQYELLPFEYKQAIDFVKRFVKDEEILSIIYEGIRRDDLKMSLTPMALELLIQVATVEREIPASITEVFERYTDIVSGRFDATRGIKSVFEYHKKKRFLAELAWNEFHLKNRLVISRGDFDSFVEAYRQKYPRIGQESSQFLSEIVRAGILQISDVVFFRHRSFLEFFCASSLAQHRGDHENLSEDVASIYFDLMWTEVAFYYTGILREISAQIAQRLDEYDESTFEYKLLKMLIGRLLQAGWDTPSEIKLKAMAVALRQPANIRNELDSAIDRAVKSGGAPIPAIFTDFFIMALAEYSFGSMTFIQEVLTLCSQLAADEDWASLLPCLLLLWANRRRLPSDTTSDLVLSIMEILAKLEQKQELAVRDKYIGLFMLKHIGQEDTELLKHINKKMSRVRKIYPSEMRRLLPAPGTKMHIKVATRTKRFKH